MWLRIAGLVVAWAWSIYWAWRSEDRVFTLLVTAARRKVGRALVVIAVYYLAFLGISGVWGLLAYLAYLAGLPAVAILLVLAGIATTMPYGWVLFPGAPGTGSPTVAQDLRRRRVPAPVARAIASPALVCTFFLVLPTFTFGAVAVVFLH